MFLIVQNSNLFRQNVYFFKLTHYRITKRIIQKTCAYYIEYTALGFDYIYFSYKEDKMKPSASKRKAQAARRRHYANRYKEKGNYIETFITQCIVCGIVLSAVLIIRIIDVPTTHTMRQHFYQTITATVDIAEDIQNVRLAIRTALGEENTDDTTHVQEAAPVHMNSPNQDFRIDEDILESIRSGGNNDQ